MESKHRTYRRLDGVIGVGYVLAFAGCHQASIAWPDREAERFIVDDMARHGVEEIVPLEQVSKYQPAAPEIIEALTSDSLGGDLVIPENIGKLLTDERLTIDADGTVTPAPGTDIVPDGEGGAVVVDLPDGGQHVLNAEVGAAIADKPSEPTDETLMGLPVVNAEPPKLTEAQAIRNYLADKGTGVANKQVVADLALLDFKVSSSQVSAIKKEMTAAADKPEADAA